MQTENQDAVIAFLHEKLPEAHTVETHISRLFIGAQTVYKLKKAVRLSYVDLGTADKRLACCGREVELNRLTAPALYRGVRRITRAADGLAFDGPGALADAVVEMARFDEAGLADRLAAEGRLTPALAEAMAGEIARFHARAPVRLPPPSGSAAIAAVLEINRRALRPSGRLFGDAAVERLTGAQAARLAALRGLADSRARAGRVRRCHGDLHLRNIVVIDGQPVLFDCLEFDDAMATVDVLYDLAFVVMDLIHRGLGEAANVLFNRYLDLAGDSGGLALMPLFLAMRATVRGHIAGGAAAEGGPAAAGLRAEAAAYLGLAEGLLAPRGGARIVAIGGFSGSGKSTVARGLAPLLGPAPGAREISSDRTRKALLRVAPRTRLPAEAYRPAVSAAVYGQLLAGAQAAAAAGQAVVVNAVFDRPADRAAVAAVAARAGVPFTGIWLDAPEAVLVGRVEQRRADPSDADAGVVRAQMGHDPGAIGWVRIDAAGTPAEVLERVAAACINGLQGPQKFACEWP
ncbi:AAA family ATPase [Pseudoxanthobacter sp.]|uniref:bifunctional aminoglycoside phosphotransferase/ATP-binding protein n=1 Tax=Pseudoxanthobacter sp. TaxID=1925742 RepID=UPI002FDFF811